MKPLVINVREEMAELVPSRRYATHAIDRYPAKMIPQLARFCIERCTSPGQTVFDPFCGCGTVVVESRLSGRASVGIDINPYAVTLTRAKAFVYDDQSLREAFNDVLRVARRSRIAPDVPSWLRYWFHPLTLRQLLRIRVAIDDGARRRSVEQNHALRAVLAITVRPASKADPRSPKPFISQRSLTDRCESAIDSFGVFMHRAERFRSAANDFRLRTDSVALLKFRVQVEDATRLPYPADKDNLYDAIVSSPPYLSAQDYYRSSKLELAVLGLTKNTGAKTLGPLIIGSGRGSLPPLEDAELRAAPAEVRKLNRVDRRAATVVSRYLIDVRRVVESCTSWTKPGGAVCFVIGDSTIRGLALPVHQWFIDIAEEAGLDLQDHYLDAVRDRRLAPKRNGHQSVIEHEHILVFRKTTR